MRKLIRLKIFDRINYFMSKKFFVSSKELLELIKNYQVLNFEGTKEWWLKSKSIKENPDFLKRVVDLREYRLGMLESETEDERRIRHRKLERSKNKLGEAFLTMADGVLSKGQYRNYDELRQGDMKGEAMLDCIYYVDRFDTDRGNPFAYFTEIIYRAFWREINDRKELEAVEVPVNFVVNMDSEDNIIV